MGALPHPVQKRILCMNKVDLVEKKKDLLKVAEEFKDLPGYERCVSFYKIKDGVFSLFARVLKSISDDLFLSLTL